MATPAWLTSTVGGGAGDTDPEPELSSLVSQLPGAALTARVRVPSISSPSLAAKECARFLFGVLATSLCRRRTLE